MSELQLSTETSENVSSLQTWADGLVVSSNEGKAKAIEMAKIVKRRREQVVNELADSKGKAYSTWKAIVALEKKYTDVCDSIRTIINKAVLSFNRIEEEKRLAEQRRLQAKADENARKERDRQLKKAEKLKTQELREQRTEEAELVTAPTVIVAPTVEKQKGESTSRRWKARVINIDKLGRQWMLPNQKALDNFAKVTSGAVPIDGVEFYEKESLSIQ